MNSKQLLECASGILVEQDPGLSWPEPELVRRASPKLHERQQDGGR
jgi:hypothetical protein